MLLEELFHLSAFLARAERADGARDSAEMPWKTPSVLVSVSQFSLTKVQARLLRRGAAEETANQHRRVLRSHLRRQGEAERPRHQRRLTEGGQRVEEAVVLLRRAPAR